MKKWPERWGKPKPRPVEDGDNVYLPWPEHGRVRVTTINQSGPYGFNGYACSCLAPETMDDDEAMANLRHREHLWSLAGLGGTNELA